MGDYCPFIPLEDHDGKCMGHECKFWNSNHRDCLMKLYLLQNTRIDKRSKIFSYIDGEKVGETICQ